MYDVCALRAVHKLRNWGGDQKITSDTVQEVKLVEP